MQSTAPSVSGSDPHQPKRIEAVIDRLVRGTFGKPLVTNVFRSMVVEAIVATALEPDWKWCSADYAGWDFERPDGVRMELKQSAALQSWRRSDGRSSRCTFDIKPRTGRYVGADWIAGAGRYAQVYVFAHHPVVDDTADHRDPEQWLFYVVPVAQLPDQDSIGLRRLTRLSACCLAERLAAELERVAMVSA